MGIARSTYYDKPAISIDDTALVETMVVISDSFEAYGYRRMQAALRHRGFVVNHKKVRRLMREHDLQPRRRRRYVATTDGDPCLPIFPNLAKDMAPDAPNQLWVADLTYVAIQAGFVYIAVILDAWSRKVVGYAIARSIDVRLTLAALRSAIDKRRPPPGCVHHTDRGSQYAAGHYRQALAKNGLVGSMGRRGNPYDNAKAESFMKTLKVEAVYPDGLRDLRRCRCGPSAVHRSHLQRKPTALRARLSQSAAVRGSTRPAHGQNRSLILSTHKGALHRAERNFSRFFRFQAV